MAQLHSVGVPDPEKKTIPEFGTTDWAEVDSQVFRQDLHKVNPSKVKEPR